MRCIGIIGAMEVEVASLKEQMKDIQVTRKASMEFYSGIIEGKNVVVVRSGIGKVNAAVCTQILIDDFKAEVVINTGIAGSLNADINIGDIVVSTDLIHHDMNAVAFGSNCFKVLLFIRLLHLVIRLDRFRRWKLFLSTVMMHFAHLQ